MTAPRESGQASVEMALLLPVLVLLCLLVVQVVVVGRDRVLLVHGTRAAARAVVLEPTEASARDALARHGPSGDAVTVELSGDRSPGGMVTVTVRARPTTVPIVGRVLAGVVLTERLAAVVEGGS